MNKLFARILRSARPVEEDVHDFCEWKLDGNGFWRLQCDNVLTRVDVVEALEGLNVFQTPDGGALAEPTRRLTGNVDFTYCPKCGRIARRVER